MLQGNQRTTTNGPNPREPRTHNSSNWGNWTPSLYLPYLQLWGEENTQTRQKSWRVEDPTCQTDVRGWASPKSYRWWDILSEMSVWPSQVLEGCTMMGINTITDDSFLMKLIQQVLELNSGNLDQITESCQSQTVDCVIKLISGCLNWLTNYCREVADSTRTNNFHQNHCLKVTETCPSVGGKVFLFVLR